MSLKIDASVACYDSALWEAEQYFPSLLASKSELGNALEKECHKVFWAQPVLIYVADFFMPDLKVMLFARWEEHEHGEAYFRELRMKQEVEALGYKVVFYATDDLQDIPKIMERLKA